MKKDDDKEIVKLTAKKLLLALFKVGLPFFQADKTWRHPANKLFGELDYTQEEISAKIKYLKQMGYIKTFSEKKDHYIEVTKNGLERIKTFQSEISPILRPVKWDGKWRIVIFDIPNDKKSARDQLRRLLRKLKFIMVQESVYLFPFECTKEVDQIIGELNVSQCVSIFVASAVRNEELMIKKFLDQKILSKSDLVN